MTRISVLAGASRVFSYARLGLLLGWGNFFDCLMHNMEQGFVVAVLSILHFFVVQILHKAVNFCFVIRHRLLLWLRCCKWGGKVVSQFPRPVLVDTLSD
jgi:hypothetical protein